jgi:hypothetical protein
MSTRRGIIDDFVIWSSTLHDHACHLHQVLQRCHEYRIALNPDKAFVGFPSVKLLGQNVTSLGISAPAERLEALAKLKFPETLADLGTYLAATGVLRSYSECSGL